MFVKFQIPISNVTGDSVTLNIPISTEFQIVDNAELIEQVFTKKEEEKAINPILDYDKVRFTPVYNTSQIQTISYNLNFLDGDDNMLVPTYYSNIGFDNSDIKFRKNYFKESYLLLSFYDSDNPLTQTLISEVEIYNHLSESDFYQVSNGLEIAGQPKLVTQIPVNLVVNNPLFNRSGYFQGFHIYGYRDELIGNSGTSLYMKARYINAKTGRITNLMTENARYTIDTLVNKQYTKYDLFRTNTGYYYTLDTTYSTNVAVTQPTNPNLKNITINLYQIQVI